MNNPAPEPQDTPNQPFDLDALAALLEAATPGPWKAEHDAGDSDVWKIDLDGQAHVVARRTSDADAALIAAARNALPDLIAIARRVGSTREHVITDGDECWCGPTTIKVSGTSLGEGQQADMARWARINYGVSECDDADCHPWGHMHSALTDEPVSVPCPVCTWPNRETTGLVCQTCGWDYANGEKP